MDKSKVMDKPKQLLIIAIEDDYLNLLTQQVREIFGDQLDIVALTAKNLNKDDLDQANAILLSTNFLYQLVKDYFTRSTPIIFVKRAINLVNIKRLIELPKGQTILVVNDTKENTDDTVESLSEILFEHQFIPYYPEQPLNRKIDYIVTPGERYLVPHFIKPVIDIGPRILSLVTISEIAEVFGLTHNYEILFKRHIKSMVALSQGLEEHEKRSWPAKWTKRVPMTFNKLEQNTPSLSTVINQAIKMALTDAPLYIQGEAGTGKSVFAEAIHAASIYRDKPFMAIDCGTDPDELEKELFGVEEGQEIKIGLFEAAMGGSIFLKNIDKTLIPFQKKLVHIMKEKKMTRINGHATIDVNVRVITSSCIDLTSLKEMGRFQPDLLKMICANTIEIPPLRERKSDIESLLSFFKKKFNYHHLVFTNEALKCLKKYSWPGNVSELFNVLSYCACLNESPIPVQSLPHYLQGMERDIASDDQYKDIVEIIEEHGFLNESLAILNILQDGKATQTSYGRKPIGKLLKQNHQIILTEQQLRKRLEILQKLNLIKVRQGRSGTTISQFGEQFLQHFTK
jgi:DNA-binding NtrC family response regulator